eukprot:GEMP01027931.1.p1 GENE.GEMP01027931.1~~GEMP01027931.1.p1  ORF type:complete len:233 (+),score=38.81 GEMP01027931.1:66-701(+)
MGTGQSMLAIQPMPVPDGLNVFGERFLSKNPIKLHLRQNLWCWSGDDFHIQDPNTGRKWFTVRGKSMSLHNKKSMLDFRGKPVFRMCQEQLRFNAVEKVADPAGNHLFNITAKFSFVRDKLTADVPSARGKQHIVLKCDSSNQLGLIFLGEPKTGGQCIAKIYRPTGSKSFGKQDYYLTIAPGVDVALMVAMCISRDELHSGNQHHDFIDV